LADDEAIETAAARIGSDIKDDRPTSHSGHA
jgi:hypothetical protein